MNILSLIKNMRELRKHFRFTNYEQLLFYELVALADNKSEIIRCSNADLCSVLNIDVTTLRRARKKLCKANLITYSSGRSKREVGQYTLIVPLPEALPDMPPDKAIQGNELTKGCIPEKTPKTPTIPPAVKEVESYCHERNNSIDAQVFFDFYTAKNWMIGKNKMKDWKAAVRTWERMRNKNENSKSDNSRSKDYTKGF